MNHENQATSGLLVCTLPSAEFRSRRIEVQEFVERARSVVSIPNGLRFVFPNTKEIAHALVDFILFEQKCCAAVTYELQSPPPHTDLVLELHASGGLFASLQALYLGRAAAAHIQAQERAMIRTSPPKAALATELSSVIGPAGAVLCSIVCLGLPAVSAVLGATAMKILGNDRFLIPVEVLCCATFLWSFERGRKIHGRYLAISIACVAAALFLGSMMLTQVLSRVSIAAGSLTLIGAMALDRRFLKRASCVDCGATTIEPE